MSSQHRFRVLIFSLRVSPFLVSKWDKQRRRKRHMKHVWGQVSKEAKLKHFSSLLRKTHFLWFVTLLNNECRRARSSELSRWNRATTRFINDAESKGKISGFALCLHALRTCGLFFSVSGLGEINTRCDFEHNCLEKALISRSHNQFWRRRGRARGREKQICFK